MFKSEKTKRLAIIFGIAFVVIYSTLFLMIQAGYSDDRFSSIGKTVLSVLSPVIAGGVIAYILNPILRFFEKVIFKKMNRPRLRRGLSLLLTYLLVLLLLIGLFSAIIPQLVSSIQEFGSNLGNYASAMQTALVSGFDNLNQYIDEHPSVRELLENMGVYAWIGQIIEEDTAETLPPVTEGTDLPISSDSLPETPPSESDPEVTIPATDVTDPDSAGQTLPAPSDTAVDSSENTVSGDPFDIFEEPSDESLTQKHELSFEAFSEFIMKKLSQLSVSFGESIEGFIDSLIGLGFSFLNFIKNTILGIFISIYLLLGKERVGAQCKRLISALFPKKAADTILRITKRSDHTAGRFIMGTLIDAVFVAIVTLIALTIFDIKYALLIAIIIGFTNMIPFFGPFIGGIPSALLLLIDDITTMVNNPDEPARFTCITFIILMLIIQQIDGNIINPRVIGNSTGLSSLGVLLSVTIMSGFFGFFGMLLGVPVAAIIIGIVKEITEYLLKKKKLPVALAAYYEKNSMVPPETPEEELEHQEHTAFYRFAMRIHEKLRHFFRKLLYRNHGKSRSLKMWVKMKLGIRSVKHKVNHTIHPDHNKRSDFADPSENSEGDDSSEEDPKDSEDAENDSDN